MEEWNNALHRKDTVKDFIIQEPQKLEWEYVKPEKEAYMRKRTMPSRIMDIPVSTNDAQLDQAILKGIRHDGCAHQDHASPVSHNPTQLKGGEPR
jgi:hypothetical protein